MSTKTLTNPSVDEEVALDELDFKEHELVVFNDDYNTFDHVIDTLIKICKHTPEQAEQCTWLIHYKGKCTVKFGTFDDLVPMRQGICERGISAEIF
ncbi:MAG: ATP-dependent Clp protease adaptor ClpS [Raineya sp.]|jgi:ATP-dependent Clp protease adaptor protein ClpS|nr:ATP-dependent Clp protease adaptor ClpS [Raineya sp.]